ncbi:MAG: site-2 protease family protein, partial [Chloroflexi bacterium]|nr:site-2 protease family protein [Chloroflexota bacterium]
LFLLTVLTTLWTGAINEGYDPLQNPANLLQGVPFSFTLLAILGVHEFGHYFMARRYKAPVTLPYFIPLPPGLGLGTMGAVIRLKAPFMDRRSLFDVGIAGPLAGLAVAVPLLFWGLSQSQVGPLQPGGLQEGNSIFYAFAKFVVFGKFLPGGGEDVFISSTAFAAWLGLFITALNLLPAGQLDGGHVAYALLGEKSRYLGGIVIGLLVILGLPLGDLLGIPYPGYAGWFTWVLFIVVFGLAHPTPLNDLTDLGMPRRLLGAFSWFLFIILFTPLPFS